MTTHGAGMAQRPPERRPWSVRVGLVLLWIATLCVAGLMAIVAVFFVATLGMPGAMPSPLTLAVGVLILLGTLTMVVVLIFATRGRAWARWTAAGIGIAAGALALLGIAATRSAAPEMIGLSVAALLGGILLALPIPRRGPRGSSVEGTG